MAVVPLRVSTILILLLKSEFTKMVQIEGEGVDIEAPHSDGRKSRSARKENANRYLLLA